jgi:hypothetical protein
MNYRYYWIIASIVKLTALGEYKMNCKILDIKDIKLLLLKVNQWLIESYKCITNYQVRKI